MGTIETTINVIFNSVIDWINMIFGWLNNFLNDESKENWILILFGLSLLSGLKNWGYKVSK